MIVLARIASWLGLFLYCPAFVKYVDWASAIPIGDSYPDMVKGFGLFIVGLILFLTAVCWFIAAMVDLGEAIEDIL